MKKARTKIYVKFDIEKNVVVYSGIEFYEFNEYLPRPIENLLLIKGDYFGNGQAYNFELLEGREEINKLSKENIYNFGDFCFVDFSENGVVPGLSKQQVAEVLYMAHLGEAMQSPFFNTLQNRFAYLAHDDGSYCKLYCRELDEFMTVLGRKITNHLNVPLPVAIRNRLMQIATGGLLIDLEEIVNSKKDLSFNIYSIGLHSDIDEVLNNWQLLKSNATSTNVINYSNNQWSIS